MDYPFTIRKTLFNRPSKNIGGDVGQALMQNSMVGVVGYQTNMGGTDCDCGVTSPNTTTSPIPIYPEPNSNYTIYTPNALNAGGNKYNIAWAPLTYTASSQTIMTGQDLIDCLTDELNLSSQVIPYYMWHYHGNTSEFGGLYNDWNGRIGIYTYVWQLDGMGMQLIGARDSAGTDTDTLSTLSIFTEEAVDATALDAVGTLTTRIPIWVNDVAYWLYLDPV